MMWIQLPEAQDLVPPASLAILKGIYGGSCLDLNIKFGSKYAKLKRKKEKDSQIIPKDFELSLWIPSWSDKRFFDYWFTLCYPFQILKGQILTKIDDKINNFYREIANFILKKEKKVVGFTTTNLNLGVTLNIAKFLHDSGLKIVLGGPGVNFSYNLIQSYDFIDTVVIGEAEHVKLEGKIVRQNSPTNLNNIPLPDYSDFNLKKYNYIGFETSRGCLNSCYYCNYRCFINGKIWRKKSKKRMIIELKHIMKYSDKIFLLDTNPILDYKHFQNFVKVVNELGIKWSGQIPPIIDKKLANLMQQSADIIIIGFESFDDRVLELMNRPYKTKTTIKTIKNLYPINLILAGFFGFPGEKESNILKTVEKLIELMPYYSRLHLGFFLLMIGSYVSTHFKKFPITPLKPSEINYYSALLPFKYNYEPPFLDSQLITQCLDFLRQNGVLIK